MKKNKGFTLIELLVVIAIIGLLATLAVVAYGDYQKGSRDSQRYYDIGQVRKGLEQFFVENERYPEYISGSNPDQFECDSSCGPGGRYYGDSHVGSQFLDNPLKEYIDSDLKFRDPYNQGNFFYRFTGNPDICQNADTYTAYLIVRSFEKIQTDLGNYDPLKANCTNVSVKSSLDAIHNGQGGANPINPGYVYQFVWDK